MKYSKKYGSLAFDFHTREFLFSFLWDWLAVWTRLMTFDRKSNIIDESSCPDTSPNVSRHLPKANYLVSLVTALINLVVSSVKSSSYGYS